MRPGLVLTYHAVERGPAPLCIPPDLFRVQLDCIVESGLETVTVAELTAGLRGGVLPARWVAITFDDGFASVPEIAAPLLVERGLVASVFCVAAYLGTRNDWPTQPHSAPRLPLAGASELVDLMLSGFEIGSHGMSHLPLDTADQPTIHVETVRSKEVLEAALGSPVRSFAYAYGALPSEAGRRLVAETYSGACTSRIGVVAAATEARVLPRVDAHYLRRSSLFRAALEGRAGPYLALRRIGASARRSARSDYARPRER